MHKLRCSTLPGLSPSARGYEFNLFEDDLRLEIPGDHRGPDLIVPDDPAQEAWLRSWRGGLRETWYCQWHFTDRAALDRFLSELGLTLDQPPPARLP